MISQIWENLSTAYEYEVAFDVTHSYRSLPMYNLILTNYYRQVSQYNITLSHIYYGCFELKQEISGYLEEKSPAKFEKIKKEINFDIEKKNIAPIIDMKKLVDVLDMTGAVTEFKNTGRPVALIKLLEKTGEDKELKKILQKLDAVMCLNNLDGIAESLLELMKILRQEDSHAREYKDLRVMISSMFESEFFDGIDSREFDVLMERENKDEEFYRKTATFQILLALWSVKLGNIGLASIITGEAIKSCILAVDEKKWSENINSYKFEEIRNKEMSFFVDNAEQDFTSNVENIDSIRKIKQYYENEIKSIRNIYAHNLRSDEDKKIESNTNEEKIELFTDMENVGDILRETLHMLYKIHEMKSFSGFLKSKLFKVLIIVSDSDKQKTKKQKKNNKYDNTYYIPKEFVNELKSKTPEEFADMLFKKLRNLISDYLEKKQLEKTEIDKYIELFTIQLNLADIDDKCKSYFSAKWHGQLPDKTDKADKTTNLVINEKGNPITRKLK